MDEDYSLWVKDQGCETFPRLKITWRKLKVVELSLCGSSPVRVSSCDGYGWGIEVSGIISDLPIDLISVYNPLISISEANP